MHLRLKIAIALGILILAGGLTLLWYRPEPHASEVQVSLPDTDLLQPEFSETPGQIVFQSDRDGDWEIYVFNLENGEIVQLTHNSADDEYPVWSPDGSQIAFKSNRNGNFDIYVMQSDGTNELQLTHDPANDEDPAWSPDGKMLAFHSDRESSMEIYLIQADGSGLTQFTKTIGKNALAAWSPDGSRIAYTGNRYLGWNVYVTTLDREVDTRITDGHGACRPDWSPDGSTIAYVSQQDTPKANIWLMTSSGSERRPLTRDDVNYDYYPAWSPDGRYLVYAKSPDKAHGNWELYLVSADGALQARLTNHPARDKFPDWFGGSPSEEAIARLTGQQEFVYEAELLLRQIGEPQEDSDASGRQAVVAEAKTSPGFLVFGPYAEYPAGSYSARFRLKIGRTSSDDALGAVDVATDAGETILARHEFTARDFQAADQFQDLVLPFALQKPQQVEFRVFFEGVSLVAVDRISVQVE